MLKKAYFRPGGYGRREGKQRKHGHSCKSIFTPSERAGYPYIFLKERRTMKKILALAAAAALTA
ncbi:hypothetical protein, partial [Dialister succinatiphilus]|uniref:hypothetical protein n=1 Tax=Dialister succinatiphilus TaxID=487173 RepID=UPI001CA3281B